MKSSDGKKFVSLKKGKTRVLIDGDVIALLPDSVCFMVVCQGDSLENGITEEQVGISKNKMLDKLLTKSNKAHDKEKPTKSSDTPTGAVLLVSNALGILYFKNLKGVEKWGISLKLIKILGI